MPSAAHFVSSVRALAPGSELGSAHDVADGLIHRWSEPHRRYHTIEHLREVLEAGAMLRHAGELPLDQVPLFHLAAWFLDAVYDVRQPGNEAQSADLAKRQLTMLQVPPRDVKEVRKLITQTTMHEVKRPTPARLAFHDADLWILSAPKARYASYRAQVRAEFAHVPTAHFRLGRADVLRPFLEREHLYLTAFARRYWEPLARRNLGAELADLADPHSTI